MNDKGEIISFLLSPGNTPGNNVRLVAKLVEKLMGKLYGDHGYISKDLFIALSRRGVQPVTGIKERMKNMAPTTMGQINAPETLHH